MHHQTRALPLFIATAMMLILMTITTKAQTGVDLQGTEAPSVINGVDIFSGKLEQILPLMNIQGRGTTRQGLYLPLRNLPWTVKETNSLQSGDREYKFYTAQLGNVGGSYVRGGYGTLGKLEIETKYTGWMTWETPTVTEIRFISNSGAIIHFRDVLTNGQPYESRSRGCVLSAYQPNPPPACSRGRVFRAIDGSNATFVSDADIHDAVETDVLGVPSSYSHYPNVAGTLFLSDGTRIRIENNFNQVSKITDRNGNVTQIEYVTEMGPTYYFLKKIKDSLNREVSIIYGDASQTSFFDEIVYKGFGGAERRIRINYSGVGNVMVAGQSLGVPLFPGIHTTCSMLSNGTACDPTPAGGVPGAHYAPSPVVPSSVVLPNGTEYQFFYNNYIEVARVKNPNGSYSDYSYSGLIGAASDGVIEPVEIYRRVSSVKNFDDSGQLINEMTLSNIPQLLFGSTPPNIDNVTIAVKDSTGTVLSKTRSYFHESISIQIYYPFLPASYGKQYKSEILDPVSEAVLRKTETTWAQREPFQWCSGTFWTVYTVCDDVNNPNSGPPVDPRIIEIKTTLETGQVTKKTYSYDQYNNVTDTSEFDFGSGAPGPLLRRTHMDYVTASSYIEAHLLNLPAQISVYDSGDIKRGSTTLEYDNYSTDSSHTGLTPRAGISGFDAAFTTSYMTRGNCTARTNNLLTNGSVTGSINSYEQYDIAGNVIKAIDARGSATTLYFTDHFGGPDGNMYSNLSPIELSSLGQSSYAFATSTTNSIGTSYTKFDYYTARSVDAEDVNGLISSAYSDNEPLDRPTKTIEAVNTSVQAQTIISYDDISRTITTSSDLNVNTDGALVSKEFFDSLGRSIETRQYEGGSNYIVKQQQYDALGRVYRASNPYRPWQGESAIWTQGAFDALGRVTSVTTADSAVATTSYSGNTVTVADQTNKQRKSVSDALGRLIQVYEAPNDSNYNHLTSYQYDALDNLTRVTQGTQPARVFVYDSLKRLISATNPESGTTSYIYDNNGNLTQKTDARVPAVTITYAYDALNRNTTIDYSDTAGVNPDITRVYDGAPSGKGHLWESYAGGNYTVGSNVEHTKVTGYDGLGRPLGQIQEFKTNGAWGAAYTMQRSYNLAGGVTGQTYPSGRTVVYSYDGAGRVGNFTGNLGDGIQRNYATGIIYSPFGGMTKEQFGTDTALYNKLRYNSRGQLSEMRVSTSYTGPTDLTWNRGKILNQYSLQCSGASCNATDNNGNLRKQEVWIPANEQASSWTTWYQQYDYDNLNRLQRAKEYDAGAIQLWQQEYTYDRWGNRTIHQTNTWGAGINIKDFTVNTANNRLGVPGGQSGVMTYDNAGNPTTNTYSGTGDRVYDAENRMTKAWGGNNQWQEYTYNADGQRVKRKVDGIETWQVYGMDGELLAEYPAGAAPGSPQKEYGYRNGQFLVEVTTAAGSWGSPPTLDDNPLNPPNQPKTEVKAIHITQLRTAINVLRAHYNLPSYPWQKPTASGGAINSSVLVSWEPIDEMRTALGQALGAPSPAYAAGLAQGEPILAIHIQELRNRVLAAWNSGSGGADIRWLVTDHLGTPRMIIDKTGTLSGVSRHDYLPFGEELFAYIGGRTPQQGYVADAIREKFTSKERDIETGLDFFEARYYASMHGRFTSPDEPFADQFAENPQSWNLYSYVRNNPLIMVDATGRLGDYYDSNGNWVFTDNINDNKVYLVTQVNEPDGSINYIPQDLGITHTQFKIISNIVRQEGTSTDAQEYLWAAHTSHNEAVATNSSLYAVLQTRFSSAPDKTNGLATTNTTVQANASRAGVIDVLTGGADPTGGARRWDGTDFIAWGLNSPNGTPHNKFEEYTSIDISGAIYRTYEAGQRARWGNSVRYGGTRYNIPAAVFTNPNNWANGNDFHYVTGARNATRGITASGAQGHTIFWRF